MNGSHFAKQTQRERTCSLVHGSWKRAGARLACVGACALMVGQLLLPSVALAADWINVGGTQYNGGAAVSDEAGTWSWNGADDMQLNGYNGGGISAEGNLNIGVTNTNTVTADAGQSAIEVSNGNLAITGDGTLNATGQTDVITAEGNGETGGDVTISGADVNVTATGSDMQDWGSATGIYASAGDVTINKGADVQIKAGDTEADRANGLCAGIRATNQPAQTTATPNGQTSAHGGNVSVDNAKLDVMSGVGLTSTAISTTGQNTHTMVAIVNGSEVTLKASDAPMSSAGIYAYTSQGTANVLVKDSTLSSAGIDGIPGFEGGGRQGGYGIYSDSNDESVAPSIDIDHSKVEASGSLAGIFARNYNHVGTDLYPAAKISIKGGSMILAPAKGAIRDVQKQTSIEEDTWTWQTSENGQVIGTAGEGALDNLDDPAVDHNTLIGFDGDPTPQPKPDPTPEPKPEPQPGESGGKSDGSGVGGVTDASKKTDGGVKTVAIKTAVDAKKTPATGALAATGDGAALTVAAMGIAGATVAAAGIAAARRREE